VLGKPHVHGRSRRIFSSEHSGPEQNERAPDCGSEADHYQNNYSSPY
jgi:hypothetical protein